MIHQERGLFLVEAAAGFAAGAGTDAFFYTLDSYKTQKQMGQPIRLKQLTKGLVPLSLTGSAPGIACFFSLYTPMKQHLDSAGMEATGVLCASALGAIPASLISVPADTIKKQVVLGFAESPSEALRIILRGTGPQGLFVGWQANLTKDVPFAAVKMSLYEAVLRLYLRVVGKEDGSATSLEASGAGLLSGVITAIVTTPLDVVNTRMKAGDVPAKSMLHAGQSIVQREGVRALFAGLAPRMLIIGMGSSLFWSLYATIKQSLSPANTKASDH